MTYIKEIAQKATGFNIEEISTWDEVHNTESEMVRSLNGFKQTGDGNLHGFYNMCDPDTGFPTISVGRRNSHVTERFAIVPKIDPDGKSKNINEMFDRMAKPVTSHVNGEKWGEPHVKSTIVMVAGDVLYTDIAWIDKKDCICINAIFATPDMPACTHVIPRFNNPTVLVFDRDRLVTMLKSLLVFYHDIHERARLTHTTEFPELDNPEGIINISMEEVLDFSDPDIQEIMLKNIPYSYVKYEYVERWSEEKLRNYFGLSDTDSIGKAILATIPNSDREALLEVTDEMLIAHGEAIYKRYPSIMQRVITSFRDCKLTDSSGQLFSVRIVGPDEDYYNKCDYPCVDLVRYLQQRFKDGSLTIEQLTSIAGKNTYMN